MNYFPSRGSTCASALASSVFMSASFSLSELQCLLVPGLEIKHRSRLSPCQEVMVFLQGVQMRSREQSSLKSCRDVAHKRALWSALLLREPEATDGCKHQLSRAERGDSTLLNLIYSVSSPSLIFRASCSFSIPSQNCKSSCTSDWVNRASDSCDCFLSVC